MTAAESPHARFAALIGERRYAYHILTRERLRLVVAAGALLPRAQLGPIRDEYALPDLVLMRAMVRLDAETLLPDTVPCYLTPRQPMFCRLVREGRVRPEDLVALGFDFDQLQFRCRHWLFATNPAYGGACIGQWAARGALAWDVLARWFWNDDAPTQVEKLLCSAQRQAELLVAGPMPLSWVDHVVTGCPEDAVPALAARVIVINGVFA